MVLHLFCKAFKMSAHSWPPSLQASIIYSLKCVRARASCSLSVMIIHFCKALCLACLLLNMTLLPRQMQSWYVGGGSEMLLDEEVMKCVCPFAEKDDGRGWVWLPFKKTFQGVSVKHFVQCQVQMLATSVSHCLLARWDVQECKVFYVPLDEVWCRQMVSMLSTFFLAAAPLSGRSPNYAAIPLHEEFVGYVIERCSALQELCSVDSVKGAVNVLRGYMYCTKHRNGICRITLFSNISLASKSWSNPPRKIADDLRSWV